MGIKNNRTGEVSTTNEEYKITIINYKNSSNINIIFENGHIVYGIPYKEFKKGVVKNPYHCSVFNVGYYGVGDYKATYKGKILKVYNLWKGMLERCYSEKYQERQHSYIGCTVDECWYNFQFFAEWFNKNYIEDFHLDKDILVKGNKIYSPETCCFIPQEVNNLFTKTNSNRGEYPIGVCKEDKLYKSNILINKKTINLGRYSTPEEAFQAYKVAKEIRIKEVAEKWKDKIAEKVYQAMYDYKVEITD